MRNEEVRSAISHLILNSSYLIPYSSFAGPQDFTQRQQLLCSKRSINIGVSSPRGGATWKRFGHLKPIAFAVPRGSEAATFA